MIPNLDGIQYIFMAGLLALIAMIFGIPAIALWWFFFAEHPIAECEADLPRTEYCVLVAVPESEVTE